MLLEQGLNGALGLGLVVDGVLGLVVDGALGLDLVVAVVVDGALGLDLDGVLALALELAFLCLQIEGIEKALRRGC